MILMTVKNEKQQRRISLTMPAAAIVCGYREENGELDFQLENGSVT